MGNTLLKDNPTMKDIKEFLRKIEDNIENYSIEIDDEDEALIFSTSTISIIDNS